MARVQKRPSTSDNNDMEHPFRKSSPQSDRLGARSCRGCHQRKVRCDRGVPCTNCSRCGVTCVYPTKDRDGVRKGPTLQNISNRLERLEILLSRFAESNQITTGSAVDRGGGGSGGEPQSHVQVQSGANVNATGTENQHPPNQHPGNSTWGLLLNDGQVIRCVNNSNVEILLQDVSLDFFLEFIQGFTPLYKGTVHTTAKLIRRIHQEERIKIIQPTDSETAPLYLQKSTNAHHTLLAQPGACAPSDTVSDVLEFYPDTQLALQLWTVYVKSVDPVLKILHIPTVQSTVVATILDPRSAQSSKVALTFAIYFAAITALCHDNNNEPIDLPCEKLALLKRYKMSLDRLLLVTDLMNQPEMTALQALAIYVVSTGAGPEINHEFLLGWSIY